MTDAVEEVTIVSPSLGKKVAIAKSKLVKKAKLKDDRTHSITFYVPKNKVPFYSESLKTLARLTQGSETTSGKVSEYLRGLIDKDFQARGLMDDGGEPKLKALEAMKSKMSKITKKIKAPTTVADGSVCS